MDDGRDNPTALPRRLPSDSYLPKQSEAQILPRILLYSSVAAVSPQVRTHRLSMGGSDGRRAPQREQYRSSCAKVISLRVRL